MNIKWKATGAVMVLIVALCLIFSGFAVYESRRNIDMLIQGQYDLIDGIVWAVEKQSHAYYSSRIKSLVNVEASPARTAMIEAFRDRNREALYQRALPFFKMLRKENPHFSTFAWILPDNQVFLRVQRAAIHGDNVTARRPDIATANQKKVQVAGYATAGTGLEYRIIQPVFYEGQYLGVVQFGLHGAQLLEAFDEKVNAEVGFLIREERVREGNVMSPTWPIIQVGDQALQVLDPEVLKDMSGQVDLMQDRQRLQIGGREHVLFKARALPDYTGQSEGWLVVALDISSIVDRQKDTLFFIFLLAAILVPVYFLILSVSFGGLLKKNINLTKSVQIVNKNLETRVAERTRQTVEQKKLLEALINNLPDVIFLKDGDGTWLLANDQAIEMFELDRGSYIGSRDKDLSLLQPRESFFQQCRADDALAWEEGRTRQRTISINLPDGTSRTMDVVKIPLFRDSGERWALLTAISDMTSAAQARSQQESLRQIIESIPDEIFIIDGLSMQFQMTNRAACNNLQYSADEFKDLSFASVAPEFARQDLVQKVAQVVSEGTDLTFTTRFRRKDETSYPVEISLKRTAFKERPAGLVFARDLSRNRSQD